CFPLARCARRLPSPDWSRGSCAVRGRAERLRRSGRPAARVQRPDGRNHRRRGRNVAAARPDHRVRLVKRGDVIAPPPLAEREGSSTDRLGDPLTLELGVRRGLVFGRTLDSEILTEGRTGPDYAPDKHRSRGARPCATLSREGYVDRADAG